MLYRRLIVTPRSSFTKTYIHARHSHRPPRLPLDCGAGVEGAEYLVMFQLTSSRLRPKTSSPTRMPLFARSKAKVTDERKENAFVAAKSDAERKRSPPVLAPRSGHELANNTKFAKKNEPVKSSSRTRYLADSEPRPKTLASKRRNVLAIRKPGKTPGGVVKAKASRREDGPAPRPAPRAFPRLRARRRAASDDDEPRHRAPEPDRLKKIRLKAA